MFWPDTRRDHLNVGGTGFKVIETWERLTK